MQTSSYITVTVVVAIWVIGLATVVTAQVGDASVSYQPVNRRPVQQPVQPKQGSSDEMTSIGQDQLIIKAIFSAKSMCTARSATQGYAIEVREHKIPENQGGGSIRGLLFKPLNGVQSVVRCKSDLLDQQPSSWEALERCAGSDVDLTCLCCEAPPCQMDPDYSINVVKFLSTIGMSFNAANYQNYRQVPGKEQRILVIGVAAGSLPGLIAQYFDHTIDVIEPDKTVIAIARECFGFPSEAQRDRVHVYNTTTRDFFDDDGPGADRLYDVIYVDTTDNEHLMYRRSTLEYLTLIQRHMQPGASVIANFAKVTEGCYTRELATYHRRFGNLYLFSVPGQPQIRILVSTNCHWRGDELDNCQTGGTLQDLINAALASKSQYFTLNPPRDYLETAELYSPPRRGTPYSSFLEGKYPPPECLSQEGPAIPRGSGS